MEHFIPFWGAGRALGDDLRARRWGSAAFEAVHLGVDFTLAYGVTKGGIRYLSARGAAIGVGQGGNAPRLVHLTDAAGRAAIESSGQIVGRHGIFAVPEAAAHESTALKVLRTGLLPNRTAQAVPIPEAATALFRRPVPIGPYSAWKYFGGTYYAAPGAINTATGAFTSGSSLIGPRLLIYGPDGAIYVVVATARGIHWYAASMENK